RPDLIDRADLVVDQTFGQSDRAHFILGQIGSDSRSLFRPCHPQAAGGCEPLSQSSKTPGQVRAPVDKHDDHIEGAPASCCSMPPDVRREGLQGADKIGRRAQQSHALSGLDAELLRQGRARIARHEFSIRSEHNVYYRTLSVWASQTTTSDNSSYV